MTQFSSRQEATVDTVQFQMEATVDIVQKVTDDIVQFQTGGNC